MNSNYGYENYKFELEYSDNEEVLYKFNEWIKHNTSIYVNPKVELKFIDEERRYGVVALEDLEYREIVARIPIEDQMCNSKFEVIKLDIGISNVSYYN